MVFFKYTYTECGQEKTGEILKTPLASHSSGMIRSYHQIQNNCFETRPAGKQDAVAQSSPTNIFFVTLHKY